jgi:hypothetical protein
MTGEDYLRLLEEHDHPSRGLFPEGFDKEAAMAKAREFAKVLENQLQLNVLVETGVQIQDTTHHTELHLPNGGTDGSWVTIRLSNFGNLATVINQDKLDPVQLKVLLDALEEADYVYIPPDVLDKPYTGAIPHVKTWMTRFFHYL